VCRHRQRTTQCYNFWQWNNKDQGQRPGRRRRVRMCDGRETPLSSIVQTFRRQNRYVILYIQKIYVHTCMDGWIDLWMDWLTILHGALKVRNQFKWRYSHEKTLSVLSDWAAKQQISDLWLFEHIWSAVHYFISRYLGVVVRSWLVWAHGFCRVWVYVPSAPNVQCWGVVNYK